MTSTIQTSIIYRDAVPEDINSICGLLTEPAEQGEILPRSKESVEKDLLSFLVADTGKQLVGCVALRDYESGLFEIRSLVVDYGWNGAGIGSLLIDEAIIKARNKGASRVFALTYRPRLFERQGFTIVPKSHFPQKVWEDCRHCRNRDNCREIAVFKDISS